MTDSKPNLLWQYSLNCYARPGVADTLLALQDDWQAEVNILLLCLWAGSCGKRLSAVQLCRARAVIAEGQQAYLLPLRALRRRLKQHPEARLYEQAKALELGLERWQQDQLFRLQQSWPETAEPLGAALLRHNLKAYAEALGLAGGTGPAVAVTLEPRDALFERLIQRMSA
ncbi:MAG: TIGR02444 family protein [Cellvibrionaceae bacterium]|nr:TIGR02444 family protein [Cellvibrionaceae bacterium]